MRRLRVANGVWAVLFTLAAALQYGRPDSARWAALYGVAAFTCVRGAVLQRPGWFLSTAVGSVALGWAAVLLPRILDNPPALGALLDPEASSFAVRQARELAGLVVTAGWMAVLAILHRPRRTPAG